MWRTSDGRVHTVSLPDPTYLFSSPALKSLDALLARTPTALVEDLVDAVLDEVVRKAAEQVFDAASELGYKAQAPMPVIFEDVVPDWAGLQAALAAIEWRWRLDVAMAVQDLAEGRND